MPARVLIFLIVSALAIAAPALAGSERAPGNPADRLAAKPIDSYAYDHASGCHRRPSPGALALATWLDRNVRGAFWGIMRCERLSKRNFSLHAEGRAIDWHLDAGSARDRRAARRLIALLLAPDRVGRSHALARRMGVQEIIWNCRSWWSGAEGRGRYSLCYDRDGHPVRVDDTSAHRDHVHIGLNRRGAAMRTSFWRRGASTAPARLGAAHGR